MLLFTEALPALAHPAILRVWPALHTSSHVYRSSPFSHRSSHLGQHHQTQPTRAPNTQVRSLLVPFALPRLLVIFCPPGQHILSLQAEFETHVPVEELCPRTGLERPLGHTGGSARVPGPRSLAPASIGGTSGRWRKCALSARGTTSPRKSRAGGCFSRSGGSFSSCRSRRYSSRRQHCGLWRLGLEVEGDHLLRSTEDVFAELARAEESATAGVWQRLKGRPRRG